MKAFGKIFRDSFDVDDSWTDWFLNKVYNQRDALTIDVDNQTASVALLTPYEMSFHGSEMPVCYINSVATARRFRGRGLASALMVKALRTAAERGDVFAALIPASRRLYFFYDAFDFSTVFYIDEQRYTSLHRFEMPEGYAAVGPTWEMFRELESKRANAIVHSENDYDNILTDLALSDGQALSAENSEGSRALIFFENTPSEVHVLDLLSTDETASEAVLHLMRQQAPDKTVVIKAMPCARKAELRSRGMMRILNVDVALTALAKSNPDVDQVIKVTDRLIPTNTGIYILKNGKCTKVAETQRHITLDVSVEVLCRILFSDSRIGNIFNLPTARPFISLMLD